MPRKSKTSAGNMPTYTGNMECGTLVKLMTLREATKAFLEMPESEQKCRVVTRTSGNVIKSFRPSKEGNTITLDADDIQANDWQIIEGDDYSWDGKIYFYTGKDGESILHIVDEVRPNDLLADDWEVCERSAVVREIAIEIGDFCLSNGIEEGKIWISRKDGEGGDFDIKELEAVIRKFYEENF